MGVVYFLLLSCLGLAVRVRAQNCSKPVPGSNMNIKGEDILLQTFADTSTVSFECDVGYQSAGGSRTITCTAGSWSTLRMKCERRNCGSAGELLNGQVDYPEGTEFGDKAVFSCDTGYHLVGKTEIICLAQGWSSRLPVCEVVTCEPPPQIVDGTYSPIEEMYSYRSVIQYRCNNNDYTLIGSKSRSCSDDGTFKPDPPACKRIQCEDPAVNNADWIRNPFYKVYSTLTLHCRSGYVMKGEGTQTCDINSKWSPGLPTCEPKNCSRPVLASNVRLNDNNASLQRFTHGTTVSIACSVGYISAGGSPVITCTAGNWSPVMLKCQKKNCGPAGELSNGQVIYPQGTEFGNKAVFTCDTGYNLVGETEIICQDQGWGGQLPVCEVVTCEPPPKIGDGTFSPNNEMYSYRDVIQYTCNSGYSLTGSESRTCSGDGTFKPGPPMCEPRKCSRPVLASNVRLNDNNTSLQGFTHGTTVSIACSVGYISVGGSPVITCTTGNWSPVMLKCQKSHCEVPAVDNAEWTKSTSYTALSTVTFKCTSGYTMKGESTQTCDVNSKWSPGLPTCEPSNCLGSWSLVLCFVVGVFCGVVLILIVQKVLKKKRSRKNSPTKNETKEDGEQVALSNQNKNGRLNAV